MGEQSKRGGPSDGGWSCGATITPMNADLTGAPPDPGQAATVDDVVTTLRALKVWAGDPSYEVIRSRVDESRA